MWHASCYVIRLTACRCRKSGACTAHARTVSQPADRAQAALRQEEPASPAQAGLAQATCLGCREPATTSQQAEPGSEAAHTQTTDRYAPRPRKVDRVVLVGGASLMPWVADGLQTFTGDRHIVRQHDLSSAEEKGPVHHQVAHQRCMTKDRC